MQCRKAQKRHKTTQRRKHPNTHVGISAKPITKKKKSSDIVKNAKKNKKINEIDDMGFVYYINIYA